MALFNKALSLLPVRAVRIIPIRCSITYQQKADRDTTWARPVLDRELPKREGKRKPEQDTPPAKLHMVYRIKTLTKRPYWEKFTMRELGLDGPLDKVVIQKNTPRINEKLMTVKHLVTIVPITFPHGLPKSKEDYGHCYLNKKGEFIVKKSVDAINVTTEHDPEAVKWRLDEDVLKTYLQLILNNLNLNEEYFAPQYTYRLNQDGKEFRYKGNHNIGADRTWW